MKVQEFITYLEAKRRYDAFAESEIQLLLSLEKDLNVNLDDYIPFDDHFELIASLTSKMPQEIQWDEPLQFAINRYMRFRLEVGTSLLKRNFSSVSDFRMKCRSSNNTEFTTVTGERYVTRFSDKYGDNRYCFLPVESVKIDFLEQNDFISEEEIEKFADCFPALDPETELEIKYAYQITQKCGTMLPSVLMPEYNFLHISILYAFLNTIA